MCSRSTSTYGPAQMFSNLARVDVKGQRYNTHGAIRFEL